MEAQDVSQATSIILPTALLVLYIFAIGLPRKKVGFYRKQVGVSARARRGRILNFWGFFTLGAVVPASNIVFMTGLLASDVIAVYSVAIGSLLLLVMLGHAIYVWLADGKETTSVIVAELDRLRAEQATWKQDTKDLEGNSDV